MKPLIWKLVLPITILSFATYTKWWYALPVDAPDTLYSGFPLPYEGAAWHTSLSSQIFLLELVIDLLVYFLFWFIVIFIIHRFVYNIKMFRIPTLLLWIPVCLLLSFYLFIACAFDNVFYFKRPYDMEVMKTGYKFTWQNIERPNY